MQAKQFFTQLGILSLGIALLLLLQNWIPALYEHRFLSWGFVLFFILFTSGTYFVADRAAQSSNLNDFSSVILGSIFGKMIFTVMIVVLYAEGKEFDSLLFLIPFFGIYIVFTIFEVYFMTKVGKTK